MLWPGRSPSVNGTGACMGLTRMKQAWSAVTLSSYSWYSKYVPGIIPVSVFDLVKSQKVKLQTARFLPPAPLPVIMFALIFSLPPSRNSHLGSHNRLFSPAPHCGSCLAFLSREDFSSFFPRRLASNCAYPRQALSAVDPFLFLQIRTFEISPRRDSNSRTNTNSGTWERMNRIATTCLLYTSPSPRDKRQSRMPSSA